MFRLHWCPVKTKSVLPRLAPRLDVICLLFSLCSCQGPSDLPVRCEHSLAGVLGADQGVAAKRQGRSLSQRPLETE